MFRGHWVSAIAIFTFLAGGLVQSVAQARVVPLGNDTGGGQVAVDLVAESATGFVLQLAAPYLEITDREVNGEVFQQINLPGAEAEGSAGRPALPLVTRLVAVPVGQTLRVSSIKSQASLIAGSFRPWPAQGLKAVTDQSVSLDRQYYESLKNVTAPPLVTVGEPSLLRGVRVVPVRFRPVAWSPVGGKLTAAAEINVSLELVASSDGKRGGAAGGPIPESFARIYENEVIGYQSKADVMTGPGTYLIIYPDDFSVRLSLQPLIDWRQRQGYNVVVASTAVTGTSTTTIKDYIVGQYRGLSIPLEFVTLVGDANGAVSIPTFTESLSGYGGEGDHEYTLLEGSDVLADVHLGRLSVTSVSMLTDVVTKIVTYESAPYLVDDNGWFTRAGLSADPASSGYSTIWVSQWVKEQLLQLNYTQIDTIWSGDFATDIYNTVNQGESIFTYRGYYGMSGVHSGYIDAMNNKEKLPFALILTCDTGSFQTDIACRSESFFRNPNGGSIAAIGTATIGTHTRYNNCMFQGVAEGVLNSGDPRVGPGLTLGKLHLYENYFDLEPDRVSIWSTWNNLMGDPATAIWTAVPVALTVDYPAALAAGANNLPVSVSSGGQPQSGALVTVFRDGVLQVSAVTDGNGQVNLPLTGLVDGAYLVTVTGRNLQPYLGGMNVGAVTAAVGFAALSVDDDNNGGSSGNGDTVVNPGETVELSVNLTNFGTGGVNDVTGDLASRDALVTVDQATAAFGYLDGGATAGGQQAYVVSLAAGVPGGATIPLVLTAASGAETWTSLVDLAVVGPAGEVQAAALGSGTINPGETTTLQVTLKNSGNLATSGAGATLSSNSNWVSVTDGSGTFGPMAVGGVAVNDGDTFAISIDAGCFPGYVVTLALDLVFAEGGTASLPVVVTVGSVAGTDPTGPDRHGYYAFDDSDTGYSAAPVYDWVEIAPDRGGAGSSVGLQDFARWQDDVVVVDLPFSFVYYGQSFTRMSICSNGWVSMGATYQRLYRNWTLPSPGTPDNLIAVYWDDLYVRASNSGVYSWYDTANNRLIVEWDNVANGVTDVPETFQVILQDPAFGAGDTGDGIITMNYKDITPTDQETGYATVGIQNASRDDAVLYTYYNLYPGGANTIAAGRSITFRTVEPQVHGSLRGEVVNASGGTPIAGATINVLGAGLNLLSAADGKYQAGLTIGTYDVAVNHASFAPDTTYGVVIQEGVETVVDFSLTDIAGPLFALQTQPESTSDTTGPYDVVFQVSDYSGIGETHFYYTSSAQGGPFEVVPQAEGPADTWRAGIPGQPEGTLVQYWLSSTDQLGFTTAEPAGAPSVVHSFIVAQTAVVYSSDMENASDWTGGLAGDGASSGVWTNVDPNGVFNGATEVSPEDDNTAIGTMCWVTGQDAPGGIQGANDVDGGSTTLQSPVFDISGAAGLAVQYYRWYTNDTGNSPGEDFWQVQARDQGGNWVDLEYTSVSNRTWQLQNFMLADYLTLGNSLQFRFVADDQGAGSVVEAGVDDFALTSFPLITDSEAPLVSLVSPNGGETLTPGTEVDITWNQSDDIGVVRVEILLSTDSGANFDVVLADGPLNGSFTWLVPAGGSTNRVQVICHDAAGNAVGAVSAADFGIYSASAVGEIPRGRLVLAQNTPNPFNPRTKITYNLPQQQEVELRIYSVEGRLVRTLVQGLQRAGSHTVQWSGRDDQGAWTASGLYFYRLVTDSGTLTRKMTLLK